MASICLGLNVLTVWLRGSSFSRCRDHRPGWEFCERPRGQRGGDRVQVHWWQRHELEIQWHGGRRGRHDYDQRGKDIQGTNSLPVYVQHTPGTNNMQKKLLYVHHPNSSQMCFVGLQSGNLACCSILSISFSRRKVFNILACRSVVLSSW